jgi:hypothetical protein
LKNLRAPREMARTTAYGIQSFFIIKVPNTMRPAGMYIPSKYFFEVRESAILRACQAVDRAPERYLRGQLSAPSSVGMVEIVMKQETTALALREAVE